MRVVIWMILSLSAIAESGAQSTLESVLTHIEANSGRLKAGVRDLEAKSMEYRTGLTPANPFVTFEHMYGSPRRAGNQTDLTVIQPFDFPTAYAHRAQMAAAQRDNASRTLAALRQDLLLDAKSTHIELVHLNRVAKLLAVHKRHAEQWLNRMRSRADQGEIGQLELNRARLRLVQVDAVIQETERMRADRLRALIEMNGGNPLDVPDDEHAPFRTIPELVTLLAEILSSDPVKASLDGAVELARIRVDLMRSMALPKFEVGYRYSSLLGDVHNGVHLGVSIPLWENRGRVATERAARRVQEQRLTNHLHEKEAEVTTVYERYVGLRSILAEYDALMKSVNTLDRLDRMLQAGQLSGLEYFYEIDAHMNAEIERLRIEKEAHIAQAVLLKHRL